MSIGMPTYAEIKDFWHKKGLTEYDEDGLKPTARDPYMQRLNEYYISSMLQKDFAVLDVGCGEGSSTAIFSKKVKNIVGIDYSKSLIDQARRSHKKISFNVCDVLDIKNKFTENQFDAVISIRCLINIPEIKLQYTAIDNILHVLKPGGLLFFSEGYKQWFEVLNSYRNRNNLPQIKLARYNKLFDIPRLEQKFNKAGRIEKFINFGEYIYLSRIAHPLISQNNVKHDSSLNKIFADMHINNGDSNKECSYAGIYVVRKLPMG